MNTQTLKNFSKGFFYEGPKQMIRGLMELTPLPTLIKETHKEISHPGYHQELLKSPKGRRETILQNFRAIIGGRPLEMAAHTLAHPLQSIKSIQNQIQNDWQTDEGKGKLAFDLATILVPVSNSSKISKLAKTGTLQQIPLGAAHYPKYLEFGNSLIQSLQKIGVEDAGLYIRGSSVTGKSFRSGQAFDVGRMSDWDVSIASPTLLNRAKELGIPMMSKGTRSIPLDLEKLDGVIHLKMLDLEKPLVQLSQMMNRNVSVMIYKNEEMVIQRGDFLNIPHRK